MKSTGADPRSRSDQVRGLVERLPGYRAFTGYSQFQCPCCGKGGLVQFDYSGRTSPEVRCGGGCAEEAILNAAESVPQPGPRLRAEWQVSDTERALSRAATPRSERGRSWPSTAYELARLRARAEA